MYASERTVGRVKFVCPSLGSTAVYTIVRGDASADHGNQCVRSFSTGGHARNATALRLRVKVGASPDSRHPKCFSGTV